MKKSGLADSPFFTIGSVSRNDPSGSRPPPTYGASPNDPSSKSNNIPLGTELPNHQDTQPPNSRDSMPPSNYDTEPPNHHATMLPSYPNATPPVMEKNGATPIPLPLIETIRKAVKDFGKEAATHRFTPEEKREIADILYTYKTLGYRTSENEITRIAVHFLLEEYRQNGAESVLDRVLKALFA